MKNKIILITGASSGIGMACVKEFAARGANIAMAARNIEKLQQLQSQIIDQYGIKAISIKTDVSKEDDCKNFIETAYKQFGKIDVLVNNAGISMRALFCNSHLNVLREVMNINFWGTVYCTKYALQYIIQSRGSIVGVSSIAGFKGLPARTGYSASKFAMQGFLEAVRIENLKNGIHVLIAAPGFTASNIRNVALAADGSKQGETPLDEHKLMSAEKVASHIANAIIHRKRTIILTSQGKFTVWLNKFFPAFMDKMVYNHFANEPDSPLKK